MIYCVNVEVKEIQNRTLECKVRNHIVQVDQPKDFGADDSAPTPPEMLAVSLGSCVVSTMQFLAMQRNLLVKDIQVSVAGEIDYSKAMGISDNERAGFKAFTIGVKFDSPMSREAKDEFLKSVFQCGASIDSILNPTPIIYELLE
jgi:uncharacterized OsmC-like protein